MHYLVGQVIEGVVTGIQPYGAFVYLDSETKGLIHISEISQGYVKDIAQFLHVGDKVKVVAHQCKLSLKALQNNMVRQRQKMHRSHKAFKGQIGFQTLQDHLDEWIKLALS